MTYNKSLIFFIIALTIIICSSVFGNILYFVNYNEQSYCFSVAYISTNGSAGIYLLHIGNALSILFFIIAIVSAFVLSRSRLCSVILLIICIIRAIVNIAGVVLLSIALTDNDCKPAKAIAGLVINMVGIFIVIIFICLGQRSKDCEDECDYH